MSASSIMTVVRPLCSAVSSSSSNPTTRARRQSIANSGGGLIHRHRRNRHVMSASSSSSSSSSSSVVAAKNVGSGSVHRRGSALVASAAEEATPPSPMAEDGTFSGTVFFHLYAQLTDPKPIFNTFLEGALHCCEVAKSHPSYATAHFHEAGAFVASIRSHWFHSSAARRIRRRLNRGTEAAYAARGFALRFETVVVKRVASKQQM